MSQLWVVDASALLATIQAELGSDFVEERIAECCVSSINWAEVLQKMERNGMDAPLVESMLLALGLQIVDFTAADSRIAASLWEMSKPLGLSLADRACLATAIRLHCPVITADKVWKLLDIGVEIHLIR